MSTITCPGCGVVLPDAGLPKSDRFNASGECWQMYTQLAGYTLSLNDKEFFHQTAIDTYESQHTGATAKNITTAFGLIGLYLAIEKGFTGKQVQRAHMFLGERAHDWPRFEPPTNKWEVTVADVMDTPEADRIVKIKQWAFSVWQGWRASHTQVKALVDEFIFPNDK